MQCVTNPLKLPFAMTNKLLAHSCRKLIRIALHVDTKQAADFEKCVSASRMFCYLVFPIEFKEVDATAQRRKRVHGMELMVK